MRTANYEESPPPPRTGQLSWVLDSGITLAAAVSIVAVVVPAGVWLHRSLNPDATVVAFSAETNPDAVEAMAGPTGSPLMWVMKDADSTVYLFGGLDAAGDVADYGMTGWMDQRLFMAFDSADRAIFEAATYPQNRPSDTAAPRPESLLFHRARHMDKKTGALGAGAGLTLPATAWRTGDQKTLTDALSVRAQSDPDAYNAMVSRNALWLPNIERTLEQDGVSFVTVGAAHLIGPDGLVKQLRQRGHSLTRLDSVVKARPIG